MGNVFSQKPLKEIVRENQRMIKKSVRELEREISNLEKQENKLKADIKKMAAQNQISTVRIMAKDLVRTRNHITRFIEMKTHLSAVGLKMQTIKSHESMAQAMKGVTKALTSMNKQISVPGLQKIMTEFTRENEKAEMTQEMMGETMDDAMEEEGTAADEDMVVGQVLDELGINMGNAVPEAPVGLATSSAPAAAEPSPTATEAVGADAGMSELEARLNNLRRG